MSHWKMSWPASPQALEHIFEKYHLTETELVKAELLEVDEKGNWWFVAQMPPMYQLIN